MARKTLDKRTFDLVKIMTKAGSTIPEIADYLQISPATISRIRASETMDEYRNICAARAIAYKAKKEPDKVTEPAPAPAPAPQIVEHHQTVTIQATHYMMTELRKTNETLELISRKLTALLECWTNN